MDERRDGFAKAGQKCFLRETLEGNRRKGGLGGIDCADVPLPGSQDQSDGEPANEDRQAGLPHACQGTFEPFGRRSVAGRLTGSRRRARHPVPADGNVDRIDRQYQSGKYDSHVLEQNESTEADCQHQVISQARAWSQSQREAGREHGGEQRVGIDGGVVEMEKIDHRNQRQVHDRRPALSGDKRADCAHQRGKYEEDLREQHLLFGPPGHFGDVVLEDDLARRIGFDGDGRISREERVRVEDQFLCFGPGSDFVPDQKNEIMRDGQIGNPQRKQVRNRPKQPQTKAGRGTTIDPEDRESQSDTKRQSQVCTERKLAGNAKGIDQRGHEADRHQWCQQGSDFEHGNKKREITKRRDCQRKEF